MSYRWPKEYELTLAAERARELLIGGMWAKGNGRHPERAVSVVGYEKDGAYVLLLSNSGIRSRVGCVRFFREYRFMPRFEAPATAH